MAGGYGSSDQLANAELYDPVAGTFTATGSMTAPRVDHTATLLPDGTVLIAGGWNKAAGVLASAEIYDPASGTFVAAGSMLSSLGRRFHTATLLCDGTVLIVGGEDSNGSSIAESELYVPAAHGFVATGSLTASGGRAGHTATLLCDGRVLVAAGDGGAGTAELYQ